MGFQDNSKQSVVSIDFKAIKTHLELDKSLGRLQLNFTKAKLTEEQQHQIITAYQTALSNLNTLDNLAYQDDTFTFTIRDFSEYSIWQRLQQLNLIYALQMLIAGVGNTFTDQPYVAEKLLFSTASVSATVSAVAVSSTTPESDKAANVAARPVVS
jgi:hypothetical protein